MGCCERPSPPKRRFARTMLPKRLILPLRLLVVAGFAASSLFIVLHWHALTATHLLIFFLQLLLSLVVLGECRQSARFYLHQDQNRPTHND